MSRKQPRDNGAFSRQWWDTRACFRKKRYASYAQAKDVLTAMREQGRAAPTLQVYRCDVRGDIAEHFHLGNATGQDAKRLIRRAEKQRRKAMWKQDAEGRSA